jgi:hypothetical protein
MPSIAHGTPATTLSFKECDDLQKPVVNEILPKMGITSKAPRSVVFGTARYEGIGINHLAAVQNHGQLEYLIGHLRCKDTTGQLIRMMMEFTHIHRLFKLCTDILTPVVDSSFSKNTAIIALSSSRILLNQRNGHK